jgi:hypothetical protein
VSGVQKWLIDKREPTPSASDLVSFVSKQTKTKEAMLLLAKMVVEIDGLRRSAAEAGIEFMKQRDQTRGQLRNYQQMLHDIGHTCKIQGERLVALDPLVQAALDGDQLRLAAEVAKQRTAQEKRS